MEVNNIQRCLGNVVHPFLNFTTSMKVKAVRIIDPMMRQNCAFDIQY